MLLEVWTVQCPFIQNSVLILDGRRVDIDALFNIDIQQLFKNYIY